MRYILWSMIENRFQQLVGMAKSFFDISKINNIDVLRLEKQCAKAAHMKLTCGDTHAHVRYKGKSRGWNFRSVSVKCGLCDWSGIRTRT